MGVLDYDIRITLIPFFTFSPGDDVPKKKPDPMIYNAAQKFLGIPADRYVQYSTLQYSTLQHSSVQHHIK